MRAAAALVLLGCALGGGDGGGSSNLPISGAGPYAKLSDPENLTTLDEPFVLIDPVADLEDPAPLALPGGAIRLFYTRAGTEIWRADLPSVSQPAGAATLAIADGARAAAPALVVDGATLRVYYENADGVARATSTDGGASFTLDGVVVPGARQPGATQVAGRTYLYYTRPDARAIFAATSDDGLRFSEAAAPALAPRPAGFDAADVGAPWAVGEVTEAGELHIGLFYTGTGGDGLTAIGFAGSFDGLAFSALTEPVLEPLPPSERGPGALLGTTQALLFFAQDRAGRSAIAVAHSP